jgi:hypothetical protein
VYGTLASLHLAASLSGVWSPVWPWYSCARLTTSGAPGRGKLPCASSTSGTAATGLRQGCGRAAAGLRQGCGRASAGLPQGCGRLRQAAARLRHGCGTAAPLYGYNMYMHISTQLVAVGVLWRDAADRQPPPTHDREARVAIGAGELDLLDLARARHALLDLLRQRRVPAARVRAEG